MNMVNHPAHYGGDTTYECIKVLEAWLTPEEFVGFCRGNQIKYLSRARQKGGVQDFAKAQRYGEFLHDFMHSQHLAGEPTGLPVAPLYWTDLYPEPTPDLRDLMGTCEHGCVHMLNSTVAPHVQWFVTLGSGEEDDVTEFFDTKGGADRFLSERLEEGRKQREAAIEQAKSAIRNGDIQSAGNLADEFGFEYSRQIGFNFVLIDGEPVTIGERDVPKG